MGVIHTLRGLVLEGLVKLSEATGMVVQIQVKVDDQDTADEVPLMQPQGVRFRPPIDSEAVLVAVNGVPENVVAVAAMKRSTCPSDDPGLGEGEGGLYYAGEWKVFLNEAGEVHLGDKAGAEFVALADKVLTELNSIKSAFDSHIHITTATVGASATVGVIQPPAPGMPSPSSVAATKVKAT